MLFQFFLPEFKSKIAKLLEEFSTLWRGPKTVLRRRLEGSKAEPPDMACDLRLGSVVNGRLGESGGAGRAAGEAEGAGAGTRGAGTRSSLAAWAGVRGLNFISHGRNNPFERCHIVFIKRLFNHFCENCDGDAPLAHFLQTFVGAYAQTNQVVFVCRHVN